MICSLHLTVSKANRRQQPFPKLQEHELSWTASVLDKGKREEEKEGRVGEKSWWTRHNCVLESETMK